MTQFCVSRQSKRYRDKAEFSYVTSLCYCTALLQQVFFWWSSATCRDSFDRTLWGRRWRSTLNILNRSVKKGRGKSFFEVVLMKIIKNEDNFLRSFKILLFKFQINNFSSLLPCVRCAVCCCVLCCVLLSAVCCTCLCSPFLCCLYLPLKINNSSLLFSSACACCEVWSEPTHHQQYRHCRSEQAR